MKIKVKKVKMNESKCKCGRRLPYDTEPFETPFTQTRICAGCGRTLYASTLHIGFSKIAELGARRYV